MSHPIRHTIHRNAQPKAIAMKTQDTFRMRASLLAIAFSIAPIVPLTSANAEVLPEAGAAIGAENGSGIRSGIVPVPAVQASHDGSIRYVSIPVVQGQMGLDHQDRSGLASAEALEQGEHSAAAPSQVEASPPADAQAQSAAPRSQPVQVASAADSPNIEASLGEGPDDQAQSSDAPAMDADDKQAAQMHSEPAAQMQTSQAHTTVHALEDPFQIRFRADTLILTPVLNIDLVDRVRTGQVGQTTHFQTYNNYPAFIDKGEVRIFAAGQSPDGEPLKTLPVDGNGAAFWDVPEGTPQALFYTYRVTGKSGKFDETGPKELTIVTGHLADNMDQGPRPTNTTFGQLDEAARRTIDLEGLMASVAGRADPSRDKVMVSGLRVPIDADGKFVSQQIVSRKKGAMDVVITRDGQQIKQVAQSFSAPRDDWFLVGQGDLTLGKSFSSGPASAVSGDTLAEGSYAVGRAAFYTKGVVNDDVTITASLDTGETLVKDLFSNLDRKDPRQLLRRLNSEQYYPTYGDDSTLVEDAPTQGRFYLRAQKDASQFVVGNFTTHISGGELAQLDRGLFGALVDYNSTATTSFGERKNQLVAFASDPGTVPAREELRGTGGSLYFLKRQDISVGSERVRVEIRDRETDLVLESHELNPREDYDFDPFQGRLTLLKPLASVASTGNTVREGSSSGNIPVLVVRYEYSPTVGDLDGYTLGARGATWVGDKLRLGATAQRDTVDLADQTLLGADAMLRLSAGTYVKAEIAQTKGPGFGQSNSVDGGLSFTDIANPGSNQTAKAWRTEVALNVAELMQQQGDKGRVSAYYEQLDQGFSSAGRLTSADTKRWGVAGSVPLGRNGSVSGRYDELSTDSAGTSKTGVVDVANRFATAGGAITAKAGLRYEDRTPGVGRNSYQDGSRTDGAVELGFSPRGQNWEVSAFAQATLDRDASRNANNRFGAGLQAQLTERLSFNGEVSQGDGGLGADAQINHRLSDGSEAYVGYVLSADRTDTGLGAQNLFTRSNRGTLTIGARQRFSDSLSVYGENRIGIGGSAPSLTRSMGLRFDPTERLSLTGSFEHGKIDDVNTGLFRRAAATLGVGYTSENIRAGSSVELRNDKSDPILGDGRDQTVILWRNNLSYALNPDWRFLGTFNMARADNESPSVRAAEFTEAMAGFAWRPVNNERVNALARFQYFEDLGPVGQITGSGQTQSPKQISTIFTADINYDLTKRLTIGGKYGYRQGKVSLARESDEFVSSNAHLAVIRADYNVAKKWDLLAEGRALWVSAADDMRLGALGAVYRHLGNNVKVGVGYSFSDFSDDLTDQSYTSHGPFINLLGKF